MCGLLCVDRMRVAAGDRTQHPPQLIQLCARPLHAPQLLTWVLPWSQPPWAAWNPWQIAGHVQRGGRLEVPPADQLPGADTATFGASGGLDAYCALMQQCWAQAPADRPSFAEVSARLR